MEGFVRQGGKVIVENTDSVKTAECRELLGVEPLIREGVTFIEC